MSQHRPGTAGYRAADRRQSPSRWLRPRAGTTHARGTPGSTVSESLTFRRSRIIRFAAGFLRTDVVGQLIAREAHRVAFIRLREHARVPCAPFRDNAIINILAALLQVRALHRIFGD